jgi:hypothetical protein
VPYDTVNDIKAPELNGFEAGMNQDGITKQYVGYGDATKSGPCGSQTECPGYINTTPSRPGCYMACSHQLMYDKTTSFYLLNHSNLEWIPSTTTTMRTLPGAIAVGTKTATPFLIGRIKSNGFWTLGKLTNGGAVGYTFWIHAGGKCVPYSTGFEVLRCMPSTVTTTTTTTPSLNEDQIVAKIISEMTKKFDEMKIAQEKMLKDVKNELKEETKTKMETLTEKISEIEASLSKVTNQTQQQCGCQLETRVKFIEKVIGVEPENHNVNSP